MSQYDTGANAPSFARSNIAAPVKSCLMPSKSSCIRSSKRFSCDHPLSVQNPSNVSPAAVRSSRWSSKLRLVEHHGAFGKAFA